MDKEQLMAGCRLLTEDDIQEMLGMAKDGHADQYGSLVIPELVAEWYRAQPLKDVAKEIYNCMRYGMVNPTPEQYTKLESALSAFTPATKPEDN